jgi:hypothetical protein
MAQDDQMGLLNNQEALEGMDDMNPDGDKV